MVSCESGQSLFSIEVIIESVEDICVSCYEPAIAFRLLDFPTVVIGPERQVNSTNEISYEIRSGKSCLFKMSKELLYERLQNTPLYLMLIDKSSTKSKLLASTTISLADCFRTILASVKSKGLDVPAVSGRKGQFLMYNLMGSHVATLKLSYRMFSFGVVISAHINLSLSAHFTQLEKENIDSLNMESGQAKKPICIETEKTDVCEMKPVVQSLQSNAFTQTQDMCIHERHASQTLEKSNEPVKSSITDQNNISRPLPLYYNSRSTFPLSQMAPVHTRESGRRSDDQSTNLEIPSLETSVENNKSRPQYCDTSVQTCEISGNYIPMQRNKISSQGVSDNKLNLPLIEALLNELSLVRTKYTRDGDVHFAPGTKHNSSKTEQVKSHYSPNLRFPKKAQNQTPKTKKFVNREPKKNLRTPSSKNGELMGRVPVKFKKNSLKYKTTKTQMLRKGMNKKSGCSEQFNTDQ